MTYAKAYTGQSVTVIFGNKTTKAEVMTLVRLPSLCDRLGDLPTDPDELWEYGRAVLKAWIDEQQETRH